MTLASAFKTAFRSNKHAPTLTFRDEEEIASRNDGVSASDGCYGGMRKGMVNGITVATETRVLYSVQIHSSDKCFLLSVACWKQFATNPRMSNIFFFS